jgi:MEMO1 family protein
VDIHTCVEHIGNQIKKSTKKDPYMKKILSLIILILLLTSCAKVNTNKQIKKSNMYENIRRPVVAGQYYPTEAAQLELKIKKYLDAVPENNINNLEIKAIMSPHAGYDFSGAIAAYAYKPLKDRKIDTVVILCNSHNNYFKGAAIDSTDAWQTPLGIVEVNHDFADKLINASKIISYNNQVHTNEQTLEVELPFLQIVLQNGFRIVPILFGNMDDSDFIQVANTLASNLGDNDLVVASTDMSHYPSYQDANTIDQETLKAIATGNLAKLEDHVAKTEKAKIKNEQTLLCGIDGVKTVLFLVEKLKWDKIEILKYANSGDVLIGDKARVVGYGTVAFLQTKNSQIEKKSELQDTKTTEEFSDNDKQILLTIARETVETYIKNKSVPDFPIVNEKLKRPAGAFVTLEEDGRLRGCIGQIIATSTPLWQVVRNMAIEAATEDPRFEPLKPKELPDIKYEVSILSQPKSINNWQQVELGKHGVIIKKGSRSGVFLPQVATETGWTKEEFLSHLCSEKAGLPSDSYKNDPGVEIFVFTAEVAK